MRLAGVPRRGVMLLALLFIALVVAPLLVKDYLLTVLIIILYFAYAGQAWNIMMGFAGQLSLGHAIYVGLGAYTAAALYVHFGIGPWIGLLAAIPVAMACGAIETEMRRRAIDGVEKPVFYKGQVCGTVVLQSCRSGPGCWIDRLFGCGNHGRSCSSGATLNRR